MQLKLGRGRGFSCMAFGKCPYYIKHYLYRLDTLSIAAFIHRVHTKTSPLVFTGSFQRICHLYSTRSSTLNFSKPKLKLTKIRCRISISGPAIWNDFVKDCLKSIEKPPFLKVNLKSKLLNFDNEISYFQYPKMIVVTIKGLMIRPNGFLRVLPLLFH